MSDDIEWIDTGRPLRLRPDGNDEIDYIETSALVQDACAPLSIGDRVRVVGVDGLGDYRLHMETGQAFRDFIHDCDFWGPTYRVLIGWGDAGCIERLDWVGSEDHAQLPVVTR